MTDLEVRKLIYDSSVSFEEFAKKLDQADYGGSDVRFYLNDLCKQTYAEWLGYKEDIDCIITLDNLMQFYFNDIDDSISFASHVMNDLVRYGSIVVDGEYLVDNLNYMPLSLFENEDEVREWYEVSGDCNEDELSNLSGVKVVKEIK